ncbi:MAG: hypothetical protein ACTSWY_01740 [Promethearchaeota archaeon]
MKFRVVLKSKTKKGHELVLKLNVAPSKHQGLINFIKIALASENDVTFKIEKIGSDKKRTESSVFGKFKLQKSDSKEE